MVTVEVEISPDLDFASVESMMDQLVNAAGLQVALRGTLKQYPGCIHWHLKRGREKGTLELTVWPQQRRIWFAVHENRHASWIDEMLKQLKFQVVSPLQGVGQESQIFNADGGAIVVDE